MESARLVANLTIFFIEMVKRVMEAVSKLDEEYDAASDVGAVAGTGGPGRQLGIFQGAGTVAGPRRSSAPAAGSDASRAAPNARYGRHLAP